MRPIDFFKKRVCGQDVETETPLHSSLSPEQTVVSKYDDPVEGLVFSPSVKYNPRKILYILLYQVE